MNEKPEIEWDAMERKLYPIDFGFGRISYAISKESQTRWQELVDRKMAEFLSRRHPKPKIAE